MSRTHSETAITAQYSVYAKASTRNAVTLPLIDDWHLHLRDGALLEQFAWESAIQSRRALIMPNLVPPVTNLTLASEYRDRIFAALNSRASKLGQKVPEFVPYMTLYLTQTTSPAIIVEAAKSGFVLAAKLYPAGATTNSQNGVHNIRDMDSVFAAMEEHGMVLCIHGETTDPTVDIFDREAVFVAETLPWIVSSFPKLRIVLEHLTTKQGVEFVLSAPDTVAATFTAHHLLCNRNSLFAGGLNPHYFCLPILKAEEHRKALLKAAVSGNKKFFAGSDSAPHIKGKKECSHGCAGCYTAFALAELYTEAFESTLPEDSSNEQTQAMLINLVHFLAINGAEFYGVPVLEADSRSSSTTLHVVRQEWVVPSFISPHLNAKGDPVEVDGDSIVPFRAGETMKFKRI